MKTTGKKLLTYIQADKDREENILKYQQLLGTAFNNYSTIKLSMNLFILSMLEMMSLVVGYLSYAKIQIFRELSVLLIAFICVLLFFCLSLCSKNI